MNKVVQFFSEFYSLRIEDLTKLSQYIKEDDIYSLTNATINDILSNTKQIDLDKAKKDFEKIEKLHKEKNINFITYLDEEYPSCLKDIYYPPKVLYYKGDISLLSYEKNIGVVGSRKPTSYGKWATSSLVKDLVYNDFCIVSGFAGGIDSISHKSALDENGRTICVFGTPIDKIYPSENKNLYQNVLDSNNLIISEHNCLKNTHPRNFALRNRIISGISKGILITEAGNKSGTLITAKYALEQGKYIFVVPGNINSPNSVGTNSLIKDGACMVCSVMDILSELNYYDIPVNHKAIEEVMNIDDLSDVEKSVYMAVKSSVSCHSEKIAIMLSMNIQDVVSILNILDLKGYIIYDGFMAQYKNK